MIHPDAIIPSFGLKFCRSPKCPHAVATDDLAPDLEKIIQDSGWPEFLIQRQSPIRHHHQFRAAVSACPNGCSQPHIADFGLIGAAHIEVDTGSCSACGLCVGACAEKALRLEPGIVLDRALCLGCASCARVCPTGSLAIGQKGYRVLLGGKLGRHPRLAHELGFLSQAAALAVLRNTLHMFMANYSPGLRLADLVTRMGQENFNAQVRP